MAVADAAGRRRGVKTQGSWWGLAGEHRPCFHVDICKSFSDLNTRDKPVEKMVQLICPVLITCGNDLLFDTLALA